VVGWVWEILLVSPLICPPAKVGFDEVQMVQGQVAVISVLTAVLLSLTVVVSGDSILFRATGIWTDFCGRGLRAGSGFQFMS
jgi:hypothetical protein